jgi:GNAT superfamily N-acetyltransferase
VSITVELCNARPRPADELHRLVTTGWPEFIFHDSATDAHLGRVRELFGDWELVLLDGEELVGAGWGVPLCWDGTVDDLPGGYTDSLARALAAYDAGKPADSFAILAGQVRPDRQREGLAGRLLTELADAAVRTGLHRVICPVRPTHKARYPLTPIERYATWTRDDGMPLDPWLRTHVRLGARILAPAPASQIITGSVADWQHWTGLALPDPGDYVIPDGLAVLHVDHATDTGAYVEPNIWVQHR